MRRLVPILLIVLGLSAGLGAGYVMRPLPEVADTAPEVTDSSPPIQASLARPEGIEVLRMPNPFLIPLIGDGRVRAMVVVSLALELLPGHRVDLQRDEPRLRAVFLQMLFDHANLGGFDGVFTGGEQLLSLRRSLLEAARSEFAGSVHDILIVDLTRQEN
jgi:flagellar protein FliL